MRLPAPVPLSSASPEERTCPDGPPLPLAALQREPPATGTEATGSGPGGLWLLPPARREPDRTKGTESALARQRVLVVDDEPEVLALLRAILERGGYHVVAVTQKAQALQAIEHELFDLVLSDLYLGDEDLGIQIAEAVRHWQPRVPVIVLTGRPSFDGAAEALRSRATEIVTKPVDALALLATCRRAIQQGELRSRNDALEAMNKVLAEVLPRAIEVKDPTTSGHADRVVRYTDTLAKRCGVSAEDRDDLRLAALLHDVGKIGIPDSILVKPGPLTEDEREVVKRHPRMGFEILAPLQQHVKTRRWVYQHHERWDGKGYPEGLAGEEVELPGRILILAEVYDALAERRSYKNAWSTEKIVALFREQAGRQFDPDLAHLVADGLERMGPRFFGANPGLLF